MNWDLRPWVWSALSVDWRREKRFAFIRTLVDGLDENGNQGTTELVDKTPEKTGKLLCWLPREFCDIHFVE